MRDWLRRRLTYANAMATIAVFLALGGGAYALVRPARDGTIEACSRKKGGALRLVQANQPCRRGERRVVWNQQGLRGTAGPPGKPGPRGETGPPGPSPPIVPPPPPPPNPDAETLDGLDSTDFVLGGGNATMRSIRHDVHASNQTEELVAFPGVGVLRGFCDSTGEKPSLRFQNTSGTELDSFFDNGGTNPTLTSIANGATENHDELNEPDHVDWQLSFPSEADGRVITLIVNAYDPPSGTDSAECRFTGLAIFQADS